MLFCTRDTKSLRDSPVSLNRLSAMASISHVLLLATIFAQGCISVPTQPANDGHLAPVRLLYEYPLGTWLENIAIRPTGELLLTFANSAHVDQLDPFAASSTPVTVATLPDRTSNFGIAETAPDAFAVLHGNFSLGSGTVPGSWSVWSLSFRSAHSSAAQVSKIVDLSDANFTNGLTAVPNSPYLLAGDIRTGAIYRISTSTKSVDTPFASVPSLTNLTAPATDPIYGDVATNGLHISGSALYFANTGQGILGAIPIRADGRPAGEAHVVASAQPDLEYDDFALKDGFAYMVTGYGDSIERVRLDGKKRGRVIAGKDNDTTIAQPTSAAFGRTEKDREVLYVVTAGGLAAPLGNVTVGAQVLAIDLKGCRW